MFITLQELELRTVRFSVHVPAGEIEYVNQLQQATPLHAEGSAELVSNTLGEIRIRGALSVTMAAPCDRCLEAAAFPLEKRFDLDYHPADEIAGGGEDEIEEVETEVAYYDGDRLDLNEVLREVVLLALPMQLVCSETCKGICPSCGLNRNQQSCDCQERTVDDRWNQLRNLRVELGPRN
jgi:uncharacterized protein